MVVVLLWRCCAVMRGAWLALMVMFVMLRGSNRVVASRRLVMVAVGQESGLGRRDRAGWD